MSRVRGQLQELRKARPRDVAAIARLARDEIQHGHTWTWGPRRVASTLSSADVLGVVATFGDDDVAGFAITRYGEATAHLLLLAVHPDARRAGLGRELVQWHLTCAQNAGMRWMVLELRAGNRAGLTFYESLGFEVVRRVRGYYERAEDGLVMRLGLPP